MEQIKIAIIGGGASGLILANALAENSGAVLFERGERLGKKLSATGNGQGNLTNLHAEEREYFSLLGRERELALVKDSLAAYNHTSMTDFFFSLGVPCIADERGRVYPSGRQASALTDALRFGIEGRVDVRLETQITRIEKGKNGFVLTAVCKGERYLVQAEKVVLCAGGKAAKNFGTDGSAYALATALGHSLSDLYPSLVQLKTDTAHTKALKGIRVNGGVLRVKTPTREAQAQGDIIFTDYGVSGDAVFRLSAFLTPEISSGKCTLSIDFLPAYTEREILALLEGKRGVFPNLPTNELLFGVVNNQIGRAVMRRAEGDIVRAAKLVKDFPLTVTGSLGYDYAQVTKGGIPLSEVTENLESRIVNDLYFAGEILDVDGQCGGFNLQWAYSSARVVARSLQGGQVCR